jgi:polysaccharide export outer membrane protein
MNKNIYLKKITYLTLIFGLLITSSCSVRNSSRILEYPKNFNTDSLKTVLVYNNQINYTEYKIKPFDDISIKNLQDPTLLGARDVSIGNLQIKYQVDRYGEIILPVIGNLKIEGLNKQEAKDKIQKLYSEQLFKDPIIELTINSLKVTLLGAFKTEGNFALENEKTDLIDIIGLAGGISEDTNIKNIRIIRGNREKPELIIADLSNINTLSNAKLTLQDGDIIIAERNKFALANKNLTGILSIASIVTLILNTYLVIQNIK